ncbi:MAG: hypothetical protein DI585_02265 [Pseudomonas fluorescens]|nr:MAG: hypothetical protein DI585_02265 [Pseudomonas fluorescens]
MIRSTYRNIMIAVLIGCFLLAFFLFRKSQDFQLEVSDLQNEITRLNQELDNARSLDVALTELDNLTITEQTATQLDILRHLGLEQSDIGFQLESREEQSIGATVLYIHNVRITTDMSYVGALALADRLQSTKKIVISTIEMSEAPAEKNTDVTMALLGKIYGLNKVLPEPTITAPEGSQ